MNTLCRFLRKAREKFSSFLKPKKAATLSDLLRAYAEDQHTNPQLFTATMKAVIKLRGLRGPHKNAFRQQWRSDYRWQDVQYLRDAADMIEGL